MNTVEEVRAIVAGILETSPERVDVNDALIEELGMDSVMLIDVAGALEKRFGVRIREERVNEFETVVAVAAIVDDLLAAKASKG